LIIHTWLLPDRVIPKQVWGRELHGSEMSDHGEAGKGGKVKLKENPPL